MRPFVDLFLNYTQDAESPSSFFRWGAYACVAAVLRDNVFYFHGHDLVYPNIYVLTLCGSSSYRKSVPIHIVSELVIEVGNTKVIRGRTSIQAVLEVMSNNETDRKSGNVLTGGSVLLCADELASFLVSDPQIIGILTDIYDFRKEYKSLLIGRGKTVIKNVCVTMHAASNEELLKTIYTSAATYGGLMARTFFIKPDEFRPSNSLMWVDRNKFDKKELINSLKAIARLKGEVVFEDDAKKEYDNWYKPFRISYKDKLDRTGVVGRVHTGALKLAIIIGISTEYDLIVKKEHVEDSISQCMKLLPNYDSYALSTGKSSAADSGALLLNALWKAPNHIISKRLFLYEHWMDIDSKTLDDLAITLDQGGVISRVIPGSEGSIEDYKLTEKAIKIYEKREKK